jgi:myxalamid-type polyketide synthase MxaE and MxaD
MSSRTSDRERVDPARTDMPERTFDREPPEPDFARSPVSAGTWDAEPAVALIDLARALVAEGVERLVIATAGGQPALPGEAPDPAAAIPWAIGRAIGLEHPDVRVRLVDLDPAAPDLAALASEVLTPDAEDLVAWRGERRLGARLLPIAVPLPDRPRRCDPDGTWLITGGLGGVGLQLAGFLAGCGARHLLLVGRHGLAAAPATALERERLAAVLALRDAGLTVDVAAVDVADEDAMRALLAGLPPDRPLRGVFHAAGVTRFAPMLAHTPEAIRDVLRAKVTGARVLDRLCRGPGLEAFVCFSSAAATWGAAGLAVYGAANHFLDLLAHRRRAAGLPALTIAWGGWAGGGMTASATQAAAAQMGLLSSPAGQLLVAMDACMQAGLTQLTVAAVDWQIFKPLLEARGERPLLRRIAVTPAVSGDGPLARELAGMAAGERWPALLAAVARRAAEVLGLADPAALDHQRGFFQMGMDSMMTVRLRRALELDTGAALPPTLALEQPTVLALAGWLAREVFRLEPPAAGPAAAPRLVRPGGAP